MTKLSVEWLSSSAVTGSGPSYDRTQKMGVVHIGLGAFHRGHQAVHFDKLLELGARDWMICAASLRSAAIAGQLQPQDYLYTVCVCEGDGQKNQVIGAIGNVIAAGIYPEDLLQAIASVDTQLITVTITEKGYCLDPATGGLDMQNPDVLHDLATNKAPKTVYGFLLEGLRRRRAAGLSPLTVLSCDNLPTNGTVLRRSLLSFAKQKQPEMHDWIQGHTAFPNSMVDRIVPATTQSDVEDLEKQCGYRDEAMVKTEPFSQWVIEDKFAALRPPLERVGVHLTSDVAIWEKAKLRLLNGAHSSLAYLGGLAGHECIHHAIHAPGYSEFISHIWDEAEWTIGATPELDIASYRAQLHKRFENKALHHQTSQIAIDGSQKLRPRFLDVIRDRRAGGLKSPALNLAVAGWIVWQMGYDDSGNPFKIIDPMANITGKIVSKWKDQPEHLVRAMIALKQIFGEDLSCDTLWVAAITTEVENILSQGAAKAVHQFGHSLT